MGMGDIDGSGSQVLAPLLHSEEHHPLYSPFFVYVMEVYDFSGKMPDGFKKTVVSHVYNILSHDGQDSEDVVDLLVSNEAYRLLSGKKKGKKKGSGDVADFLQGATECKTFDCILYLANEMKADPNGGFDKPITFKDGTTLADKMTERFASMLENHDAISDGVLNNYMSVCEYVLGKSVKYKLMNAFVGSVGKQSDNDVIATSRILRDYLVDWDAISTAVDYMGGKLNISLTGNQTPGGDKRERAAKQHFRDAVSERIQAELEWGNSEGLFFWMNKMNCKIPKALVNIQRHYGVVVSEEPGR